MKIHVAVAVIINEADEILISHRSKEQHEGNKWEFPGGKVEPNETLHAALKRELDEELGIQINTQKSKPLTVITHDYGSKTVVLDVHEVYDWQGEPQGMEGQPIKWVNRAELATLTFPEANQAIIDLLL